MAILLQDLLAELTEARRSAGVTQTEMGRRIGVVQSGISQFERGACSPSIATVLRYAEALGLTVKFEIQ